MGSNRLHTGLRKQWDREFGIMGQVEHVWYSMCFTFSFTGTDVKQWAEIDYQVGVPNSKFMIFQTFTPLDSVPFDSVDFWVLEASIPIGLTFLSQHLV